MSRFLPSLLVVLLFASTAASAAEGDALADRVATNAGVDDWSDVERVAFTWKHLPSGNERSFVWHPAQDSVAVTFNGTTTRIHTGSIGTDDQRRAHAAFVNDHYWMLFELRLALDTGVEFEDLGPRAVPGFDDMGDRRALRVHYTGDAGYTPGDAYVLYLGDDDLPDAWAFHRGGAEEPSLVTTRQDWGEAGGIRFPTRFVAADGTAFITIEDVTIE